MLGEISQPDRPQRESRADRKDGNKKQRKQVHCNQNIMQASQI